MRVTWQGLWSGDPTQARRFSRILSWGFLALGGALSTGTAVITSQLTEAEFRRVVTETPLAASVLGVVWSLGILNVVVGVAGLLLRRTARVDATVLVLQVMLSGFGGGGLLPLLLTVLWVREGVGGATFPLAIAAIALVQWSLAALCALDARGLRRSYRDATQTP
ncbi:MAG: hypothetical protein AAF211_02735 [Myxococcota bacterium]